MVSRPKSMLPYDTVYYEISMLVFISTPLGILYAFLTIIHVLAVY